jgi:hypothetical protein
VPIPPPVFDTVAIGGKQIVVVQGVLGGQEVWDALDLIAFRADDGSPAIASSETPVPTADQTVVAALQALQAAQQSSLTSPRLVSDDSPPTLRLNKSKVSVTTAGVQVCGARPGRKSLFMRHAGDQSATWALRQRVYVGWGAIPNPGDLPEGEWMDPGDPWQADIDPAQAMYLILDQSAPSNVSETVTFSEFG